MDAIKAEKEIAMKRFRRLRQIGQLLRCIEAAAALILLSYSSIHIPAAARNSGEFLHRAAVIFISPRFVFLLGNAIVLVLLKSCHFSPESAAAGSGIGNICGEISYSQPPILGTVAEDGKTTSYENRAFRRSRSEKHERRREEVKLRRAATECLRKGRKAHDREKVAAQDSVGLKDEVDAEEFRRTVEEFIARQQRFRREESLAVVATSDGPEDLVPL
ncbi:uncharacterized protein LOC110092270 [Dendrobium catenatum]|uniref:DUF4408 domain-containing protein n=1 Tax=Dendrobium catenatum TaxID=906689 RepID=A0A2I0X1A4_9ASPA|nr:uncharacterized protein LOC110092270 [Dendrobium catenatum]PKU81692.1 hypothetical protein MA16_Dca024266 [Dendrobium catenatum]